jgi:SET domain-containing protein
LEEFFEVYAGYNRKTKKYYLCEDNARFMNHSNSPNTFYDRNLRQTIAISDIQIGEEITTNYCEFDDHSTDGNLGFTVYE